jgi:hypothetical protein
MVVSGRGARCARPEKWCSAVRGGLQFAPHNEVDLIVVARLSFPFSILFGVTLQCEYVTEADAVVYLFVRPLHDYEPFVF